MKEVNMTFGMGTIIYHPELSNFLNPIIGARCTIHAPVWFGDIKIADDCKVQAFSFIPTGVTLGNRVFIGPHVVFTNDKNPPSGGNWSETNVEDDVVIGANATILPGITLGKGCRIGAGAVVTKNVPEGETWVGNPARKLTIHKEGV